MPSISTNVSLHKLNTFKVKAFAASFIQIDSLQQLKSDYPKISSFSKRIILGGGSNLLFIGDYSGLVIYPQLKGIQLLSEDDEKVVLRVSASEVWHEFVEYCLNKGYFGLENLALVPGTVGAAPVQNIGAYGVEVESFITQVECFDLNEGCFTSLSHSDCQFAYRDSVIKQAGQGQYLVTSVDFVLSKKPKLVLTYKPLFEYFANQEQVSARQVFERVCEIRSDKLPDPKRLANAGSFFKNPLVNEQQYRRLKNSFPQLIAYSVKTDGNQCYKLAAGWLIETAGFKGKVYGKVGVHKHQALVLVNYSDDKGANILALAKNIMQAVKQTFDIELETEVRILGGSDPLSENQIL